MWNIPFLKLYTFRVLISESNSFVEDSPTGWVLSLFFSQTKAIFLVNSTKTCEEKTFSLLIYWTAHYSAWHKVPTLCGMCARKQQFLYVSKVSFWHCLLPDNLNSSEKLFLQWCPWRCKECITLHLVITLFSYYSAFSISPHSLPLSFQMKHLKPNAPCGGTASPFFADYCLLCMNKLK